MRIKKKTSLYPLVMSKHMMNIWSGYGHNLWIFDKIWIWCIYPLAMTFTVCELEKCHTKNVSFPMNSTVI